MKLKKFSASEVSGHTSPRKVKIDHIKVFCPCLGASLPLSLKYCIFISLIILTNTKDFI